MITQRLRRALRWAEANILRRRRWQVDLANDGTYHLHPLQDRVTHVLTDNCICGPTTELHQTEDGDHWLTIHHSLDGRENHEPQPNLRAT